MFFFICAINNVISMQTILTLLYILYPSIEAFIGNHN